MCFALLNPSSHLQGKDGWHAVTDGDLTVPQGVKELVQGRAELELGPVLVCLKSTFWLYLCHGAASQKILPITNISIHEMLSQLFPLGMLTTL